MSTAKPGLRSQVVHTLAGDNTTTYTVAMVGLLRLIKPIPLMPLTAGGLLGAKGRCGYRLPHLRRNQGEFTNWRAGFPAITIDDKPVVVIGKRNR